MHEGGEEYGVFHWKSLSQLLAENRVIESGKQKVNLRVESINIMPLIMSQAVC